MQSRVISRFLWLIVILSGWWAGCHKPVTEEKAGARPVRVIVLEKTCPAHSLRLTGSAKAWREESLAFEISGRLEDVVDEDTPVGIHARQQDGNFIVEGEVVAQLDSSRYDAEVASALAQLESAKAEVDAIQREIDEIIPQDINRAKAQVASLDISLKQILPQKLDRARVELDRVSRDMKRAKQLYDRDTESEGVYDLARAQYQMALSTYREIQANFPFQERELEASRAELEKAKASLTIKDAQLEASRGKVKMTEAQLVIARRNQSECQLRTPFSGIICERKVSRGAVVGPGRPVAVVTTMDPMMVDVAVSSEVARNILAGDPVVVYPPSLPGEGVEGWVQNKSVAADASTRTYTITCMVRNHKITPRGGGIVPNAHYVTKEDAAILWRSDVADQDSPLMVWVESVLTDQQGYFAWTITDFRLGRDKVDFRIAGVKKVRFELGEGLKSFARRHFYEIRGDSGFEPGMLTLRKDFPHLAEGMKLTYVPTDWMIRPGDLVPVAFDLGRYPEGVYAPIEAIFCDGKGHYLFVVEKGKAVQVAVTVGETFRETRRIEAEIPLEDRDLIVSGAHYVKNGDEVLVSRIEERP